MLCNIVNLLFNRVMNLNIIFYHDGRSVFVTTQPRRYVEDFQYRNDRRDKILHFFLPIFLIDFDRVCYEQELSCQNQLKNY